MLVAAIFGVVTLAAASGVYAQTAQPQLVVTWRTSGSYAPSDYQGKILPGYGARIIASLEAFSGGSILNLKSQTIYWYLNDVLLGGGVGVQTISFPPFGEPPTNMTLRVELPRYSSGYLLHEIQIPTVQPTAVIDAPYPRGNVSASPVTVNALPYFFNVTSASDLSYSWAVNDQTGGTAENPQVAQITIPAGAQSGATLAVSLTIKNTGDSTAATAYSNLTYVHQL